MAVPDWVLFGGVDGTFSGAIPAGQNQVQLVWRPRSFACIFEVSNYLDVPAVLAESQFRADVLLKNIRIDFYVEFAKVYTHFVRYPQERISVPIEVLAIQQAFYGERGDGYNGPDRPRLILNAPEGMEYFHAPLNLYINF